MSFHIASHIRDDLNLQKSQYDHFGRFNNNSSNDIYNLYDSINSLIKDVSTSEIRLLSLIIESIDIVISDYQTSNQPSYLKNELSLICSIFSEDSVSEIEQVFHEDTSVSMKDLMILCFENLNPAADAFKPCFTSDYLNESLNMDHALIKINDAYKNEKKIGINHQTLPDFIFEPIKLFPNSLEDQLRFILENWSEYLGDFIRRIQEGLDQSAEEMKFRGFGGNALNELPDYNSLDEIEGFSPDTDWMPNVVMIAKNALVWMDQLSRSYGRGIHRLDQIPEEEIKKLSEFGVNAVWLIGIWKRSPASKTIKHRMGNPDAEASAYSLSEYEIADDIGGWEALGHFKHLCARFGIRIAGDMVPNHTGLDSPWLADRPDWYISTDHPPFHGYTYSSQNISSNDKIQVILEDHYYSQSDAAVTFKLIHNETNAVSYVYHGNDGTSMPWNDTAQLDYLNPEVREAIIQTIIKIAKSFPIIRFDAAMTLAKKHIQRLWFPIPGEGGGIPSRWNHAMSNDVFHKAIPIEFWREVVDRVAEEVPDTLLLAEAFWMMEGYFVRTLGMHRVYNSAFMNMLKMERNSDFHDLIKKTLEYDPQILKRYVNFLNNPDEETAVKQFGKADKYFGVTVLMCTLPGLPMFGHGQIEGFEEKYGMEFRRSYWDETPDQGFIDHHYRIITPILKNRYRFSNVENFQLFTLLSSDGTSNHDVFAFTNGVHDSRSLVLYNNSGNNASGWLKQSVYNKINEFGDSSIANALNILNDENTFIILKDLISGLEYLRQADYIHQNGIYVELNGYQHQVYLEIRSVKDNSLQKYKKLCDILSGRGVVSITDELLKMVQHETDVLFVSAEVSPFSKAGGLADVAGSLPGEIVNLGTKSLVITPLYSQIDTQSHNIIPYLISGQVKMGSSNYPYEIYYRAVTSDDPEYFFIYNEHFFGRKGIYVNETGEGFSDNNARYFFFQYVIIDLIQKGVIKPNIVHCNDHHTALLPMMLKNRNLSISTLLTVHNFHYQGWFGQHDLHLLNPEDIEALNPVNDNFNALEEGIMSADHINTVSPRYAHELLTDKSLSFGLYKVLKQNRKKFTGILNGVNYSYWSPETDSFLKFHFDSISLEGKTKNKKQLLEKCGFTLDTSKPVIGMISRLVDEKGYNLILRIIDKLIKQNIRLVFLGTGDIKIVNALKELSIDYSSNVCYFSKFDEEMAHLIEAGSDMFLMPSLFEPCGLNQIYSLKYGTIPIVHYTGGLADTIVNWDGSNGTGFIFKTYSKQALYRAITKALACYKDEKSWKRILSNAMKQNFSWSKSASQYIQLYQNILGESNE